MKKINFLDHTDSKKLHAMQQWYKYTLTFLILGGSIILLLHVRQWYRWWGEKKEYVRVVKNGLKNDRVAPMMKKLLETKDEYQKRVVATNGWVFSYTNPAVLLSAIISASAPECLRLFHLQNKTCSFELVLAQKEEMYRIMDKLKAISCLKKIKFVSLTRQNDVYRVRINGLTPINR